MSFANIKEKVSPTGKGVNQMAKGKYEQWLTEEGLIKIEGWAKDGLIDEDIAKNMGINVRTLYTWQEKYDQIKQALKVGKEVADRIIENALYKSAQGYKVSLKKAFKVHKIEYDPKTGRRKKEYDEIVTAEEEEYVPAQVTAQIFWLKNRKPDKWRDKPVDETIDNNITIKWEEEGYAD